MNTSSRLDWYINIDSKQPKIEQTLDYFDNVFLHHPFHYFHSFFKIIKGFFVKIINLRKLHHRKKTCHLLFSIYFIPFLLNLTTSKSWYSSNPKFNNRSIICSKSSSET